MKLKIDIKLLDSLKSRDKVPCECENCGGEFLSTKNTVLRGLKGTRKVLFCSRKCMEESKLKKHSVSLLCARCGKQFTRLLHESKGETFYCSQKCANLSIGERRKKERVACLNCGETIERIKGKFCSHLCFQEYRKKNETLIKFKNGVIKWRETLSKILHRERGQKCEVCSLTEWMGKPIKLQVDHINGDASNNLPSNLRLICPNCHSFTDTFGGKNKGFGRKARGLSLS